MNRYGFKLVKDIYSSVASLSLFIQLNLSLFTMNTFDNHRTFGGQNERTDTYSIDEYRLISLLVHQPPSWCLVTQWFISIFSHKHTHKYPNNQSFLIHTHSISIHTYRYVLCDCTIAIQSFFIHLVLKEVEASGEEITGHRTYATFLSFSLTTAFAGERERERER